MQSSRFSNIQRFETRDSNIRRFNVSFTRMWFIIEEVYVEIYRLTFTITVADYCYIIHRLIFKISNLNYN